MIAKKVPVDRSKQSSFSDTLNYIQRREENHAKPESTQHDPRTRSRILATALRNLRAAERNLHAIVQADPVTADAIRIRIANAQIAAYAHGARNDEDNRRNQRNEGAIKHDPETILALARKHLQAAENYDRAIGELGSEFDLRLRAYRSCVDFIADALKGRDRTTASDYPAARPIDLLGAACEVISKGGIHCRHNCLSAETAMLEMSAVASRNRRVVDPLYHFIISWQAHEAPSNYEAFESGAHALAALDMLDNQYMMAIHRDTDNVHLHVVANAVHPDTYVAAARKWDYLKLDKAMRELEIRFGFSHDRGPYQVVEADSQKRVVRTRRWESADPVTRTPKDGAFRMEHYGDRQSFFSFVQGRVKQAVRELLERKSVGWQDLHECLLEYSLCLKPKGMGFAIYPLDDLSIAVKASDVSPSLSRQRLELRLGEFRPPLASVSRAMTIEAYDNQRSPRDAIQRDERRNERATARKSLKSAYDGYRVGFDTGQPGITNKARFVAISDEARRRRKHVLDSVKNPLQRKALYSIISFETLRSRELLKQQIQEERAARRAKAEQCLSFKRWVLEQAEDGNPAAVSQLRGWSYAKGRRQSGDDATPIACVIRGDTDHLRDGVALHNAEVRDDGSLFHLSDSQEPILLDKDNFIQILAPSQKSAIERALDLAAKRFPYGCELQGDRDFIKTAISLIVENKVSVKLLLTEQQEELRISRVLLEARRQNAPRP